MVHRSLRNHPGDTTAYPCSHTLLEPVHLVHPASPAHAPGIPSARRQRRNADTPLAQICPESDAAASETDRQLANMAECSNTTLCSVTLILRAAHCLPRYKLCRYNAANQPDQSSDKAAW